MFRRERRVPCKLNNVTKRKHQTVSFRVRNHKKAPKKLRGRVQSITGARNYKKHEAMTNSSMKDQFELRFVLIPFYREFDPGSGRTLAACLTHASRTRICGKRIRPIEAEDSGGRVSNAWGTCLSEGDNSWKRLLIPHDAWLGHPGHAKDLSLKDGLASD